MSSSSYEKGVDLSKDLLMLQFYYNEYGKPALAREDGHNPPHSLGK